MTLRHFTNRFFTIIKLLDYFVFPEQTEHTSITTHYHKNNGHTDLRQYCQISLQQTHKLLKKLKITSLNQQHLPGAAVSDEDLPMLSPC